MATGDPFDLIIRNATLPRHAMAKDIGIKSGRIAAVETQIAASAPEYDAAGKLLIPGFVDSHIHLDKACLLGRCGHIQGGLAGAIAAVAEMKRSFTEADIYARGAHVIEKAIVKGTTHMRTHVEVDPRVGLRSFAAIKALKADYAWALDLQICAFPQEGLTNDPGTEDLLVAALRDGADVLGGCPYTDTDPAAQIAKLFSMAQKFDVDLDFHLDFDLDPNWMHLHEICQRTEEFRWQGRVAVGHVTKLSMLKPDDLHAIGEKLRNTGIALTVLPATDLYLMGRQFTHAIPRGVTPAHRLAQQGVVCSIATNNVQNPFTPFGDASLLRTANLYANIAQCGPEDFETCLDLVTASPARQAPVGRSRAWGLASRPLTRTSASR